LTNGEINEKGRSVKGQPNSDTPSSSTLAIGYLLVLFAVLGVGAVLAVGVFEFGRENQREVSSLRKEIETLNSGQVAMRNDMNEMRDLLRRAPTQPAAPRDIMLTVGDAPFKGNANAKLTLVEFTDYECGFCARHVKETFPQLERDYVATGKLKYVFRNFPLESIHKQSFKAHEAAACAGEQGKFWEMHDRLFASQPALAPTDITGYAQTLGLDMKRFQACLSAGAHTEQIRKNIAEGEKAGVTGTPTFFLGVTTPNSPTLKVTKTIVGAKAYTAFKEEIDALLAAPPSS
jgi:protein-disulfide isomerase